MSDQSWILLRLFGVKNHQILEILIWQMLCYLTRNALFFMFLGFLWMIAGPSILDSNYFIKIWEQKMEAPLIENWKEIEGLSLHQILHLWPLSPRFSLLQIWPIYAAAHKRVLQKHPNQSEMENVLKPGTEQNGRWLKHTHLCTTCKKYIKKPFAAQIWQYSANVGDCTWVRPTFDLFEL